MAPKLSVNIGKLKLKNPLLVASGTFGYAQEFEDLLNLKKLGAVVSKTITLKMRQGNPMPRTCETPAGMLNSIGLENPGIDKFIQEKLPYFKKLGVPLVVSIASETDPREFVELARRLNRHSEVAAIELNISCPNLGHGGLISQDPKATYGVVQSVRRVTSKTLITKLSPNVTDITEIALAAEAAQADAISLINTVSAMCVDIETRRPKIAMVTAGLSGPAIRPIAVRMVWEVYQKIKLPIIGMGGIMDASSALEFFISGATAISTGTANFVNPRASNEIIEGIKAYLIKNKITDIKNLKGRLNL